MSASDTCAMLCEAYEGEATKESSVSEWHKRFKWGHEDVEYYERSGCPRSHKTDENVEKMQNLVYPDRRLSIIRVYNVETLKRLHSAVHIKSSEFLSNNWILYHDSALAHNALSSTL
jgi:hypothetical protein